MNEQVLGKNGKPLYGAAKAAALEKIKREIRNNEYGLIEVNTRSMTNEELTIIVLAHQETILSINKQLREKFGIKSVVTKTAQAILTGLFLSSLSVGIFCLISPTNKEIGALAGFVGGASARILVSGER